MGGGVLDLIARETGITDRAGQYGWLADRGLIDRKNRQAPHLSPSELAAWRQRREAERKAAKASREAEKADTQVQAADRARWLWGRCKPASSDHPYCTLKGIEPTGLNLCQHPGNGALVIPMFSPNGALVNLQFIHLDGAKRFQPGGRVTGCYTLVGTDNGQGRVFCEGYATGYTVHQATGKQAVVAFNAGNLPAVTGHMARDGDVVAADNDNATKSSDRFGKPLSSYGTGHKAAMATGLPFYLPPTPGHDFNDMATAQGIEAVRSVFESAPISSVPVFDAWKLTPAELDGSSSDDLLEHIEGITEPAQAAALAYSIAARLAHRAPAQISLATIRQAIEAAAAPGALHPATLDAIMGRLDKAQAHRKRRALEPVSLPSDIATRHRHERLPAIPELGGDDWQGVIVVKAPMASGKTQRVGRPLAEWAAAQGETLLAICHRVSLVAELANRLKLTHYGDVDAATAYAAIGLATCLPSITKSAHASLIDRAGIVFIDEVAQVLRFIESESTCRTSEADNQGVYERLREIVAAAHCVVVADAGVDRRTIEFLESCRPGEQFRVIEVIPPRDAGIKAHYGYGAAAVHHAVGEALAELAAVGKPWVAVESIDRAKALEHFFKAVMPGKRIMAVHSGNKDNRAQRDFLADADRKSREYDLVIASPVIGSGLSIEHKPKYDDEGNVIEEIPEGEKFTLGVYIGGGHRTTPADAAQQMRRVRYLTRFEIALVANTSTVGNQSPEAAIAAAVTASKIEGKAAPVTTFDELVASIRTDAENARADFAAGLLWQLKVSGWKLERQSSGQRDDAPMGALEVGQRLKESREHVREAKQAALIAAPAITDERAQELGRLKERAELTSITLEAHRIRRALGIIGKPLDDEILAVWDDGRAVARLDRFSAFRGIVSDFDDSTKAVASRRYYEACARAYGWLFDGIDTNAEGWLTPDAASMILDRIMEQRHLLAHLGIAGRKFGVWIADKKNDGQPRPMKLPAYPVREVIAVMERMGLKMQRNRKRAKASGCDTSPHNPLGKNGPCVTPDGTKPAAKKAKGNPIIRVYQPTPESLTEMQHWSDSRNAARKVTAVDTTPRAKAATTLSSASVVPELVHTLPSLSRAVKRSLAGTSMESRRLRPLRLEAVNALPAGSA
ncbi:hypothetical protein GCM10008997_26290 [Halomonas salifodinae]